MFNVLVFIDWYLPGYRAGGPITSCANMVRALKNQIHFKIVTRNKDYCNDDTYDLPTNQWIIQSDGEEVMYLSDEQLAYKNIKRIIQDTPCEVVYINGMYSRLFSIYPLLISLQLNKRIIIASRGMLAPSAIGVKRFKKNTFLKIASLIGLYRNVQFHATNPKELQDVKQVLGAQTKVSLAANISKPAAKNVGFPKKVSGELHMISIARIAPEKNLQLLLRSLLRVRQQIKLNIYGSIYNEIYWKSCQALIAKLPQQVSVVYCGLAKPHEVEQLIQAHHVLVLPTLGENFGHVIAESFLAGRPVIISDQTPWKDLEKSKLGMVISLDEEAFAAAISFFADADQAEMNSWISGAEEKGRRLAEDQQPVKDHLEMFLNQST